MTRYLLDSHVCIACLRRRPWALAALGTVPAASVAVSSITVGELLLGTRLSEDPARELLRVQAFLRPIQILPFDVEEASRWAEVEARLRRQGNRIEAEDGMIAATAMGFGLTLVTGNTKRFGRVKGLKTVDWELQAPGSR